MSRVQTDLLRLLSISAVLIIHATGSAEFQFNHKPGISNTIAVLFNQLARFSVPVFIILSGYGLSLKYNTGRIEFRHREYFHNRFLKVGLPFIFWTLVFYFLMHKAVYRGEQIIIANLFQLSEYLFIKGIDYHFYFFIIILQCYIAFIVLRKQLSIYMLTALFILHLVFAWPSHPLLKMAGIEKPVFQTSFIIYWVFYFYLGMFTAVKKFQINIRLIQALLILSVMTVIVEYFCRADSLSNPGYYNHFSRMSVTLYSIALWSHYREKAGGLTAVLSEKKAALIQYVSSLSFTVFIFHTWLLRLLEITDMPWYMVTVLLLILSFAAAAGLDRLLPDNRYLRPVFGLGRKKYI